MGLAESVGPNLAAGNPLVMPHDGEMLRWAFGGSLGDLPSLIALHEFLKRGRPLGSDVKFGCLDHILCSKVFRGSDVFRNVNIIIGKIFIVRN